VNGYCEHLRQQASGRGGEAGQSAREELLGMAQADLVEAKVAQLRGETVPVAEVEAKWIAACRMIRARVPRRTDKMRDLPVRQHVRLSKEASQRAYGPQRREGLMPDLNESQMATLKAIIRIYKEDLETLKRVLRLREQGTIVSKAEIERVLARADEVKHRLQAYLGFGE
jgi:hypothetical protein